MNNKKLIELYNQFLDSKRPIDPLILKKIEDDLKTNFIYNSNAIEGNTLSPLETQVILEYGITVKGKSLKEHLEVKGQEYAINFLKEEIKYNTKLSLKLIKDFHTLVIQVNDPVNAGIFKKYDNKILGASFNTTPYYLVEEQLNNLLDKYNNSDEYLIHKIAKFHSDFEKIHPFSDGNGRVGRLIINYELMKNGYPICILENDRRLYYYKALQDAQTSNNYNNIITFIEESLIETFIFYFEQISYN